ncbi:MAG: molybdopterin-dependent oxidoreductase, partial [Inquilinus sp.]|nr:molybdopterin-dependent oxidoreductase [Inquilinus sp.]
MSKQEKTKGLNALYAENPDRADWLAFGRVPHRDRRGFLKGAGLAAIGAAVGATIPFHRGMPAGLIPAALAQTTETFAFEGKNGLTLLNDRPLNAETPAHLLDDAVTPNSRHFVRNNGLVPDSALAMDASDWALTIDGLVDTPLSLSLDELRRDFDVTTLQLTLECGGNGRAYFNPGASGNQWTFGAVGSASYTGVRLRDVLRRAGVKREAIYTGHYGADAHLSGDPAKRPISRGVPIDKAMDEHNLIAFEMNGDPLPALHGFPARLVVPGWPGSCSQKWLTRIQLRDV